MQRTAEFHPQTSSKIHRHTNAPKTATRVKRNSRGPPVGGSEYITECAQRCSDNAGELATNFQLQISVKIIIKQEDYPFSVKRAEDGQEGGNEPWV